MIKQLNWQINQETPSFLSLSDDDFMLLLCVRPEHLADPARWCAEMRVLARAKLVGPKTTSESEALQAIASRLANEASGRVNNNLQ